MISLDTSVNGGNNNTAQFWNYTHVIGAGAGNFLIVGHISQTSLGVQTVTYGAGQAMTQIDVQANPGNNLAVSLWYLVNPAQGSHTIQFGEFNSGYCTEAFSISYFGAGGLDSTNKGNANANNITVSTTVVKSNCWLVGVAGGRSNPISTASSNVTDRQSGVINAPAGGVGVISDSNATVGTGSQSIAFTDDGTNIAAVIASIFPFISKDNGLFMVSD